MTPAVAERRQFLAGLGKAGALLAAAPWLQAIGYAQIARGPARVAIRRAACSGGRRPAARPRGCGPLRGDAARWIARLRPQRRSPFVDVVATLDEANDLKAFNTIDQPNRVTPQPLTPPAPGSRMTFELPARSYTVARLAVTLR